MCVQKNARNRRMLLRSFRKKRGIKGKRSIIIPKTLDEAYAQLDNIFAANDIKLGENPGDMIRHHHGLGQWIRNKWNFWSDAPSPSKDFFVKMGYDHADDMSGALLVAYWHHKHGMLYDFMQRKRKNYVIDSVFNRTPKNIEEAYIKVDLYIREYVENDEVMSRDYFSSLFDMMAPQFSNRWFKKNTVIKRHFVQNGCSDINEMIHKLFFDYFEYKYGVPYQQVKQK